MRALAAGVNNALQPRHYCRAKPGPTAPAGKASGAITERDSSRPPWWASAPSQPVTGSGSQTAQRWASRVLGMAAVGLRVAAAAATMGASTEGTRLNEEHDLYQKVARTIEVIRPAVQADGGDIHLRSVDEATGVVCVELVGACVSCPASTVTLKAGIERILKDRVEGVSEVRNLGETELEGTPLSL